MVEFCVYLFVTPSNIVLDARPPGEALQIFCFVLKPLYRVIAKEM